MFGDEVKESALAAVSWGPTAEHLGVHARDSGDAVGTALGSRPEPLAPPLQLVLADGVTTKDGGPHGQGEPNSMLYPGPFTPRPHSSVLRRCDTEAENLGSFEDSQGGVAGQECSLVTVGEKARLKLRSSGRGAEGKGKGKTNKQERQDSRETRRRDRK